MAKKDLVALIKANPGCVAIVDNDMWTLYKKDPDDHEGEPEEIELVNSDEQIQPLGDGGYGSGNCYGGDILQALAVIVGVKVKSV
jgi:hypothetical protein